MYKFLPTLRLFDIPLAEVAPGLRYTAAGFHLLNSAVPGDLLGAVVDALADVVNFQSCFLVAEVVGQLLLHGQIGISLLVSL